MSIEKLVPSREYEFDAISSAKPLCLVEDPSGECHFGTGATVWDAGLVLAKYLEKRCFQPVSATSTDANRFSQRAFPYPTRAIELGSGTGIVGLVFAHCLQHRRHQLVDTVETTEPDQVILTDKSELLPLMERNIAINPSISPSECQVTAMVMDWTDESVPSSLESMPIDVILLSDLLFDITLYDPLLDTLNRLASQNTEIILAFERRQFDQEAEFFAKFGQVFTFHDIKPHELHEQWQSEDIYVFSARKRQPLR
ncbi:putative methyltransferase-domain-containing protein [Syncephalis plumigaleata]|nr:putative methyltransferase-domain-containing protein [Syncephalis plumigaleata]